MSGGRKGDEEVGLRVCRGVLGLVKDAACGELCAVAPRRCLP